MQAAHHEKPQPRLDCSMPAGYLESAMKERPILFSGAMVRALLDGSKTQTRRIVTDESVISLRPDGTPGKIQQRSKFGVVGDRLWVRESHWYFKDEHNPVTGYCPPKMTVEDVEFRADGESTRHGWCPSIHMPRWASRLTLEITGVRVERLQDISEADALAEGSYLNKCPCLPPLRDRSPINMAFCQTWCHQHGTEFKHLWKSINGPGSWDLNPFVWAISFRVIKP